MVRRRLTTPWSVLAIMPGPAPAVSPGSHDLLASDVTTVNDNERGRRTSSSPRSTVSTDLAVAATDLPAGYVRRNEPVLQMPEHF